MPIRFEASGGMPANDYETTIQQTGRVPTRVGDWHDGFNALVWCTFPATKAALNAAHDEQIRRGAAMGRGVVRDALTLFDECGALVLSADPDWIDQLRAHRWREALFDARDCPDLQREIIVMGHATLDALRSPFFGLCAKVLYRQVPESWFAQPESTRWRDADDWMAAWLRGRGDTLGPRDFAPLPLLGWPAVVAENAAESYYADPRQFRPRRQAGLAGLRCR